MDREEIRRSILNAISARCYNFPRKFVPWGVGADLFAQPKKVRLHRLGAKLASAHEEDVSPVASPTVCELWALKQSIDEG